MLKGKAISGESRFFVGSLSVSEGETECRPDIDCSCGPNTTSVLPPWVAT
jgi:hypothetical protein